MKDFLQIGYVIFIWILGKGEGFFFGCPKTSGFVNLKTYPD